MTLVSRLVAAVLLLFVSLSLVDAQSRACSDAIKQSRGSYTFRRAGEAFEIPIAAVAKSRDAMETDVETDSGATECYPVALALNWANGRNNGGIFRVTFLDTSGVPVGGREMSAFMFGNVEVPLNDVGAGRAFGRSVSGVPAKIVISTKEPFRAPAGITYSVVWIENARKKAPTAERESNPTHGEVKVKQDANQVVGMKRAERLIGSSRIPLVRIELRAGQPLPITEAPLQLRIGKRVFVQELSGDHTGRQLTLSLTPQMFAELEDGSEIVAFFEQGEAWSFGKLRKDELHE
jgi:hypothetical protein